MDGLVFETALGYMAFARANDIVLSLTLGHRSERAAIKTLNSRLAEDLLYDFVVDPSVDDLVDQLYRMADGDEVNFDDVEVDMTGRTPFQLQVLAACRAIPRGETRSYGELAKAAGRPGAARAVGSVMASNRTPLIIPCHRVVLASGAAGHFSAPQGEVMRRRLLGLEGPAVSDQPSAVSMLV